MHCIIRYYSFIIHLANIIESNDLFNTHYYYNYYMERGSRNGNWNCILSTFASYLICFVICIYIISIIIIVALGMQIDKFIVFVYYMYICILFVYIYIYIS